MPLFQSLTFERAFYLDEKGEELPEGKGSERMGMLINILESDNKLTGSLLAVEGDWIIKGVKGEFYLCKPDIFKDIYDPEPEVVLGITLEGVQGNTQRMTK